jgi:glycosyltransferase involved in cell wall biosynthesis
LLPGVRVLDLGTNRFFGEANNIATEHAAGTFVCFMNNDAFPQPGWLEPLLDALQSNPAVGAAGPKLVFPDGRPQESGSILDEKAFPIRLGRMLDPAHAELNRPRDVDYISAAALLMPRAIFDRVGGFDLAFEPAYYEDTDLCFRLRLLGRTVRYCPESVVKHIEGASTDDVAKGAYRKALGDLNRGKFVGRWGEYLATRAPEALERLRTELLPPPESASRAKYSHVPPRSAAAIFTPYPLTPGGGERYLLTLAAVLSRSYAVAILTPFPYSQLRLANLAREFGLEVGGCRVATYDKAEADGSLDLWIAMSNHVVPSVPARGRRNWHICQFPFPMDAASFAQQRGNIAGYQLVLSYSSYTRTHIERAMAQSHLPPVPVHILHPPVPMIGGNQARKKRMILNVGRFFSGGHAKRHDVLLDAFRDLIARFDGEIELHLAGSSSPLPQNMDYLAQLHVIAADLPVRFHVNPSRERLWSLYQDAMVYWHATGYGARPDQVEQAEHFGISVVEAMSASCVPIAFNSGGPSEIIEEGVSGFLFDSIDTLLNKTVAMLQPGAEEQRLQVAHAASVVASRYSVDVFRRELDALVHTRS